MAGIIEAALPACNAASAASMLCGRASRASSPIDAGGKIRGESVRLGVARVHRIMFWVLTDLGHIFARPVR
jgi:hypothetical protein